MENAQVNQTPYPFIIGIDVSKLSIDVATINAITMKLEIGLFGNNSEGYQKMKKWLKQLGHDCDSSGLYCMEHTGIYTRNLVKYLMKRSCKVWMESSLHIKRSIGLVRGKSDKIDAERICKFAYSHQHEAKLVKLSHPTLSRLRDLMKTRINRQTL